MPPPREFNPDPPPPNFNDAAYRASVEAEAIRLAKLTAAITLIARYVPGPVGKVAALASVAFLGNPGENKKGNLGGAKTNPLPAPVGFAKPDIFGLKPNYYLPAGSTQIIPQPLDLLGLGINEQRVEDMNADQRANLESHRKFMNIAAQLSDAKFAKANKPIPAEFGLLTSERLFGGKRDRLARNTAFANEALFRANPDLRRAVQILGYVPTEVLTGPNAISDDAIKQIIAAGSLHPENIDPVNAKAMDNEERAEGIRRQLVSERADP